MKITSKISTKIERITCEKFSAYSIITAEGNELYFQELPFLKETSPENKILIDEIINHNLELLGSKKVQVNLENEFKSEFLGIEYTKPAKSINEIQKSFNLKNNIVSSKVYNLISDGYKLIDWQTDFRSGYRWDEKWFKDIKYGNNKSADIKVPWELGRMQHLLPLAIYYSYHKDKEVAQEIENQILDFISQNPPGFGVQWKTSMDVGIRLVNWLFVLNTLEKSNHKISDEKSRFIKSSIVDHFVHIKSNIEFSEGMRGNHFLSNICSLIIACLYFGEDYKDRLQIYINVLNREINYHFNPDGSNFEASTAYHLLSSEMIFITLDLLESYDIEHNIDNEKLELINSFSQEILSFKTIPQIGDNDSGFYIKPYLDKCRNLEFFKSILVRYHTFEKKSMLQFPDFGYYRLSNNSFDIIIKNGHVGQKGKGGHAHNDNLSFLMYFNGKPVISDPGTFVYTSNKEIRNKFRSTEYHNVIICDNYEQNEINFESNDDVFWIDSDRTNPKVNELESTKFTGTINYLNSLYTRRIEVFDDKILIEDELSNEKEKILNLHLHPDVKVSDSDLIISTYSGDLKLNVQEEFKIERYSYSPEYGEKQEANLIKIKTNKKILKIEIEKV